MATYTEFEAECVKCHTRYKTFTNQGNCSLQIKHYKVHHTIDVVDSNVFVPLCSDCSELVRVFIGLDPDGYIKTTVRRREEKAGSKLPETNE